MHEAVDRAGLRYAVEERPAQVALLRGHAVLLVERELLRQCAGLAGVGPVIEQHLRSSSHLIR